MCADFASLNTKVQSRKQRKPQEKNLPVMERASGVNVVKIYFETLRKVN